MGNFHTFAYMSTTGFTENDMYFGMYLCTKGHCLMTVNDRRCRIEANDALVKSPLVRISDMTASNDFEYVTIFEDDIDVLAPIATYNVGIVHDLLKYNKFNYTTNQEERSFLLRQKGLIDAHKAELHTGIESAKQRRITAHIVTLMEQTVVLEFIRMFLSTIDSSTTDYNERENNIMVRFMFLLFEKYNRHRQVAYYAEALHLSANHFTRIIKKISRRTPSEWIAVVTINHAKKLLRQPETSIKEVAQQLNFPEQFTFRKYFKQHTGMSPSDYRDMHSRE